MKTDMYSSSQGRSVVSSWFSCLLCLSYDIHLMNYHKGERISVNDTNEYSFLDRTRR